MDLSEYQTAGSASHGGAAEDLDFNDLTEQINEYDKALSERLQAYHEGNYPSPFLCSSECLKHSVACSSPFLPLFASSI